MTRGWKLDQSGMTVIEMMIAIAVALIMMFAMAMPYSAEKLFWRQGEKQTAAQRDAQLIMRTIALAARESRGVTVTQPAGGHTQVIFDKPCGASGFANVIFDGGPNFNGGAFQETNHCSGATATMIDGVRSEVLAFDANVIGTNLVKISVDVLNENLKQEQLTTQLYLRNKN